MRVDAPPRYVRTKEALIEMIKKEEFPNNRLPAETALCELLGVSRTTIREALIALNREGFITKKHGLGNLIHRSTLDARMRMDQVQDFRKMLEQAGYTVHWERSVPEWTSRAQVEYIDLSDLEEDEFLMIESTVYADGRPAIYGINYIMAEYVRRDAKSLLSGEGTFYDFMSKYVTEEIANSIIVFRPMVAEERIAAHLQMGENIPLISWQGSFMGIFDHLLCRNMIFFHPDIVDLTLLRKWA